MPWYLHSKCNSTTLTNITNIRRLFRKPFYFSVVDARVRQVGEFSESYFTGISFSHCLVATLYWNQKYIPQFWICCRLLFADKVAKEPNLPNRMSFWEKFKKLYFGLDSGIFNEKFGNISRWQHWLINCSSARSNLYF